MGGKVSESLEDAVNVDSIRVGSDGKVGGAGSMSKDEVEGMYGCWKGTEFG